MLRVLVLGIYILKLKYGCYLYILFKKETNLYSKSKLVDKLANMLKNLIVIW